MEMDASNTMNIDSSDCDDRSLFGSLQDFPIMAFLQESKLSRYSRSICIKSNGEVTSLELSRGDDLNDLNERAERSRGDDLNERESGRLGCFLSQNAHVEELKLTIWTHLDMIGLCAGLQSNQCIQKLDLSGIDLRGNDNMNALAPLLIKNPSLKQLFLQSCGLGTAGINILSTALLNRSEDTLEYLCLSNNHFGDIDLDQLVLALNRNRNLRSVWLYDNEIGLRGCTSLTKLLSNRESNLLHLDLNRNSIDNESTIILADSLAKNTKLKRLRLYEYNAITSEGWTAVLKLVCNSLCIDTIMKSNHSLDSIGYLSDDAKMAIRHSLGTDDANVLYASLDLNKERNKNLVVRLKTLWSHARGDLNLGDYSIGPGAMTRILGWISDDSNEFNANIIQYHEPPLPKVKLDAIRLDSIYRILRSTPDLLLNESPNQLFSHEMKDLLDYENKDLRGENKKLGDNNTKDLCDENEELRDETKEALLRAMWVVGLVTYGVVGVTVGFLWGEQLRK